MEHNKENLGLTSQSFQPCKHAPENPRAGKSTALAGTVSRTDASSLALTGSYMLVPLRLYFLELECQAPLRCVMLDNPDSTRIVQNQVPGPCLGMASSRHPNTVASPGLSYKATQVLPKPQLQHKCQL